MYVNLETDDKNEIMNVLAQKVESGGYANITLSGSGDLRRIEMTTDVEPEPISA
jgi:putative N-acetylmannosamine-6-phosphate epimerase